MKKLYTPGPWWVQGDDDFGYFVQAKRLKPGHPYDIEILGDDHHPELYPEKVFQADCRLIAKSPEMADALEAALPYLKQCNISGSHVVAEEIEKIIKEIEGEENV